MTPRRVLIAAFPAVQSLDVCGPLEVFTGATAWLRATGASDPGYQVTVAARGGEAVRTSRRAPPRPRRRPRRGARRRRHPHRRRR